ncbi:velum formation-related protein [Elasticomyces elasticus]|nr:velum formation-related protein [Elasticomyces elasticus]KAK4980317.1 velum formation- protein [Elasticomyces elasticus]
MEQPRVIPVDNESKSSAMRTTKDGKQLLYTLEVLQQPVRARACGAGAKSSADRRPVDPPPIVMLRIFDGQKPDQDITFSMNANYFLFATLEQARPMAHGRVAESKQQLTVLTGTPVAGMVYLDRPNPAGYFIFPDLSVRHEGKYRLGFSLYEELKDVKFEDGVDGAEASVDPCVTHRLEVKSEPFTVFSAKKFPGLTESTSLSRMVADQGCRVRIRRDVRMRRRDAKGKDWDDYEDDTAQARARMSATPETSSAYPTLPTPHGYADTKGRPRSASDASRQSLALPLSRKPSLQDLNQSYNQPFSTGPHTPQNGYAQSSPYGPSPTQQYQAPPFMQQPPMQPPPPQYPQQQSYHAPPSVPAPAPSPQGYYGYAPALAPVPSGPPQYSAPPSYDSGRMSVGYPSQMPPEHRHSYTGPSPAYTAPFVQQPPTSQYPIHEVAQPAYQPPAPVSSYAVQHGYQHGYSSHDFANRAPPPQPVQPPIHSPGGDASLASRASFERLAPLPPLRVPADLSGIIEPSPVRNMSTDSYYPATSETRKRQHGSVFREPEQYAPMRQGARPRDTYGSYSSGDVIEAGDDGDDSSSGPLDPSIMRYKRAYGGYVQRELPPHSDE